MPKNKSLTELTSLKTAVINHHAGDNFAYLRGQMARDACFTSNNAISWKVEQMSEVKGELVVLRSENAGREVTTNQMSKKLDVYKNMQAELDELELRHQADLAVHSHFVGETWTKNKKSKVTKNQLAELEEIDKLIASK